MSATDHLHWVPYEHFYEIYFCFLFQIILVYCMTGINSQLGPLPPRFSIPGAIISPVRQPIQYRNERLVAPPNGGFLRTRRPVLATPIRPNTIPFANPNSLNEDAKPVTEENESGETQAFIAQQQPLQQPYIPQVQTLQQQPLKHQLPAVLYTTDENGEILDQHRPLIDFSTTPRFVQSVQSVQPLQEIVPTTIRTTGSAQRFVVNQDRPVQSPLQGTTKPPVRNSSFFSIFFGFFRESVNNFVKNTVNF